MKSNFNLCRRDVSALKRAFFRLWHKKQAKQTCVCLSSLCDVAPSVSQGEMPSLCVSAPFMPSVPVRFFVRLFYLNFLPM